MLIYRILIFSLALLIISCQEEYCENKTTTGENCTDPCSANCLNNICYKNGACEKCPEGKSGNQCDKNCDTGCKACDKSDSTICTECIDKYYLLNKKCLKCNEGCKDGNCDKIDGKCECIEGYYGTKCENKCSNCPSGGCNINGTCIDQTNNCKDLKHFGPSCNESCSANCSTCNRKGECTKCSNPSKFGLKCDNDCSNCPGKTCNITGICNDTKNDCSNLLYYGEYCNKTCNADKDKKNCKECHRNGICTSCNNNKFFGDDCNKSCERCFNETCFMNGTCTVKNKCAKGYYYGIDCNKSCEDVCSTNGTCDINGKCTKCSNESFYGDKCQYNCTDKCYEDKCDINGKCINKTQCAHKDLYGDSCEHSCKEKCKDGSCKMDGKCVNGCSPQHYGAPTCENNCSSSCSNSTCHDNGTCTDCNDDHYYGPFCNISVSQTLKNCTRATQFLESCKECKDQEYFGDKCENECNKGCKDKKCKTDGKCEGCEAMYYGLYCNNTCEGCGNIGCDDQGYCKDFKCIKGKYGLKCDGECECGNNSNSLECGKFSKECLNCKFGYFGTQCEKRCNYKCKTGLCCLSKEEQLETKLKIESNYKYLTIYLDDKKYEVEIDYNYGFPLTLFNATEKKTNCTNIKREIFNNMTKKEELISHYDFTNYFTIGSLFKNYSIKFENGEKVSTDIVIASEVNCRESPNNKDISGVIGLGFFNSISIGLFNESSKEQNILSYSLQKDDKSKIELLFGSLSEDQGDYIDKLTSCKVVFGANTDIQGKKMTCELNGIRSSKHSTGLKLNNATITFSIAEKSSFVLGGNKSYMNYIKTEYLNEECVEDTINETTYCKYPADKINKLSNFGFVFNNYFYSYEPSILFSEETDANNKRRFLIGFSEKVDKTEFILGKKFLENITFTINNEEAIIYFYAKNAEFSDKLEDYEKSSSFSLNMGARQEAAICLAIVIFIDIVAFLLYYCLKNRKKKSNIIKIE